MPQEIKDEPQVKITEQDEDEESETLVSATVSEDDQNGAGIQIGHIRRRNSKGRKLQRTTNRTRYKS